MHRSVRMISDDEQLHKAQSRLREIQRFLKDKQPGQYPVEETEAAKIFERILYYLMNVSIP